MTKRRPTKSKKADLALGGFMFGNGNAGSLGGYQSTAEGQVIAASLVLATLLIGVVGTTVGQIRAEAARRDAEEAQIQYARCGAARYRKMRRLHQAAGG